MTNVVSPPSAPEDIKNKIRPIYAELQTYLTFSPKMLEIYDSEIWNQYHLTLVGLAEITGEEYTKYMVTVKRGSPTGLGDYINLDQYKLKLAGLISRLHVNYFFDEPTPFTKSVHTRLAQLGSPRCRPN